MFIHDIIKIRYSSDGYLIDHPYHMISDAEMIQAFYDSDGAGYFSDNFPCLNESIEFVRAYNLLVLSVLTYLLLYKNGEIEAVPDWVYSYMLGSTISVNSSKLDIHDLAAQLGTSTVSDTFTQACSEACLVESRNVCGGYMYNTMNINSFSANTINDMKSIKLVYNTDVMPELYSDTVVTLYDLCRNVTISSVYDRPPTMFGEPHVLKALRLRQITL